MLQSKKTEWLNGILYVYQLQETHFRSKDTGIGWKQEDGKKYSMQMEMKRKLGH